MAVESDVLVMCRKSVTAVHASTGAILISKFLLTIPEQTRSFDASEGCKNQLRLVCLSHLSYRTFRTNVAELCFD